MYLIPNVQYCFPDCFLYLWNQYRSVLDLNEKTRGAGRVVSVKEILFGG